MDDFDEALSRARTLVVKLEEEPHVNPNTGSGEFEGNRGGKQGSERTLPNQPFEARLGSGLAPCVHGVRLDPDFPHHFLLTTKEVDRPNRPTIGRHLLADFR